MLGLVVRATLTGGGVVFASVRCAAHLLSSAGAVALVCCLPLGFIDQPWFLPFWSLGAWPWARVATGTIARVTASTNKICNERLITLPEFSGVLLCESFHR